jgi:DNA-binding response OmpR family regulator
MRNNPEILAIDDDRAFAADLKTFFEGYGIGVTTVSDPVLSESLDFERFTIILLDLDMPGRTGQEVLAGMPVSRRATVIIVSGHSDLDTRIRLLEIGADFFLSKPVDLTELLLICRRILGRKGSEEDAGQPWSVSRSRHTLTSPTGVVFGLTSSEFQILKILVQASPDVVSKDALARAVTAREGAAAFAFHRSLEVMISRMRTRFSEPDHPVPIKALRNVGYTFHGEGELTD